MRALALFAALVTLGCSDVTYERRDFRPVERVPVEGAEFEVSVTLSPHWETIGPKMERSGSPYVVAVNVYNGATTDVTLSLHITDVASGEVTTIRDWETVTTASDGSILFVNDRLAGAELTYGDKRVTGTIQTEVEGSRATYSFEGFMEFVPSTEKKNGLLESIRGI